MKRQKRRELFAKEGLTWQKIVHFCTENGDKAKLQAANQELKSLLLAAKQIGNYFLYLKSTDTSLHPFPSVCVKAIKINGFYHLFSSPSSQV